MVSVDSSLAIPRTREADPDEAHSGFTLADAFVATAMGVVAMAIAVGLVIRLGTEPPTAAAASMFVYLCMLTGHIALRRAEGRPHHLVRPDQLDRRNTGGFDRNKTAPKRSIAKRQATNEAPKKTSDLAEATATVKATDGIVARDEELAPIPGPKLPAAPTSKSSGNTGKASAAEMDQIALAIAKTSSKADAAPLEQLDLGNFRPRSPADLDAVPASNKVADLDNGDNIDDMIRRLANDIEAGRNPSAATAATEVPTPRSNASPPPIPVVAPPMHTVVPGELSQATPSPSAPPSVPAPEVPSTQPSNTQSPASAKLAAIAEALADERLDVFLETINGLKDYRASHYEVSVRLNLGEDITLENDAYISETRGTGLLPLIEAVKVSNTKRLAVQMIRRGRAGEFFSAVDGEALADSQFGEDVETITAGDQALASRLILAFSQSDIRSLTPAQKTTLAAIAGLGFRFSIEEITDLDMDFDALAKRGFTFAKLDAEVFLKGLPTGPVEIPATDICKHLERAGLAVIVGRIDDDEQRARILELGAVFGQGALFGTPQRVRADILRPAEQRPSVM